MPSLIDQRSRMCCNQALAPVRKLMTSKRVSSVGLPSRLPWLRTAMHVALPGRCYFTHSGAGMDRRVQVISRPRFSSRLLVRQGIRRP